MNIATENSKSLESAANINSLRDGVSQLMMTLQQNQTCNADVERLADQLSNVVSQVNGIKSNLKTVK